MAMTLYARDGHDNNFHLIRHLAAIAVVLTHSYAVVTGVYEDEPLVRWLGRSIGHYAVDVFFVLSGFLVTQSLARDGDLVRFTVSRLLRIFPALIVTIALTTLVLGPMVSTTPAVEYFLDGRVPAYFAGAATTIKINGSLPGVFTSSPEAGVVNVSLWTLKYELAAYALLSVLAAIVQISGRTGLAITGMTMVAAFLIGREVFPWPETESAVSNALHLLLTFFFGSAAYMLRTHIPLTAVVVVALLGVTFLVQGTAAYEVIEKTFIAYTLIWIGFLPGSLSQNLAQKGDISYGIYILAFPIQQTFYQIFPDITPLALFVVALAVTVSAALLLWNFVEKPSLRFRRPIISRLRPTPPET